MAKQATKTPSKTKVLKAAAAAGGEKPAVRGRREKLLARLSKASNVTFTLEVPVRKRLDALAREAGMNLNHYMQKLVEAEVIASAEADDALAERLAAKRWVIDHVVAVAARMDAAGTFDEAFILSVIREAQKDPAFEGNYAKATEAGEGGKAARARVSLNQQMGRMIKQAVGARSKRGDGGKILRAQVEDELIATYTLLEKAA